MVMDIKWADISVRKHTGLETLRLWFPSSDTKLSDFRQWYVGKQQVAWKEYCESMERCSGSQDITKQLNMVLNAIPKIQ